MPPCLVMHSASEFVKARTQPVTSVYADDLSGLVTVKENYLSALTPGLPQIIWPLPTALYTPPLASSTIKYCALLSLQRADHQIIPVLLKYLITPPAAHLYSVLRIQIFHSHPVIIPVLLKYPHLQLEIFHIQSDSLWLCVHTHLFLHTPSQIS